MNRIELIVQKALDAGRITPAMRAEIHQLGTTGSPLSMDKFQSLDRLLGAVLAGKVVATPQRQFVNVMEDLVKVQAIQCLSVMDAGGEMNLDLGEIVAYALNRLPPLYATTEEGARFQHQYAEEELQMLILLQVNEAIANSLVRPEYYPERELVHPQQHFTDSSILNQITDLLCASAPQRQEAVS